MTLGARVVRPPAGRAHFGQSRGLQLRMQSDFCYMLGWVACTGAAETDPGAPCSLAWLARALDDEPDVWRLLSHGYLPQ